ncbi:MAG: solanesyl diphosphate synthase [Thermostichales cyanobacterium BF4_bins_65]
MTSAVSPFALVEEDLRQLLQDLRTLVGARHPILALAAEHLFSAQGKGIRPMLVLLVGRATTPDGSLLPRHRRLAQITEMIHTASLVHDDVIDTADKRRGVGTVNHDFGNRVAVLAGDFLFAQSSWYLANLDHLEVVKLLSQVIKDFAEGEIRQSLTAFDLSLTLESYLEKNFYKTASLLAGSAKAAALLSDASEEVAEAMYEFGRCFGIAFQIIDDLLDYTSSSETLGKPAGSDLSQGNLTAPVLYALGEFPELAALIERHLTEPGDLQTAVSLVRQSQGIPKSRQLASSYVQKALRALEILPSSPAKQALMTVAEQTVSRFY